MPHFKTNTACKSDCESQEATDSNITAKYKRLKAEEIVMLKSLLKLETKDQDINSFGSFSCYSKTQKYISGLKSSISDIKNMFKDIKSRSLDESLNELDIDEMKRDVTALDKKIVLLQDNLQTELNSLKVAELALMKQIDEEVIKNQSIKRKSNLGFKSNKEYVLSPVKSIITTPARCLEVQKFQDFMKNSPNRYGGWIEYNHCIFVKLMEKFGEINITSEDYSLENHPYFPQFVNEVVNKCHGLTKDDVTNHVQWYIKYVFLKEAQQNAIKKWKTNKNIIKKKVQVTSEKRDKTWGEQVNNIGICDGEFVQTNNQQIDTMYDKSEGSDCYDVAINTVTEENMDSKQGIEKKYDLNKVIATSSKFRSPVSIKTKINAHRKTSYMQPTKQWLYKSNMYEDETRINFQNCVLDHIHKLHIPTWRNKLE